MCIQDLLSLNILNIHGPCLMHIPTREELGEFICCDIFWEMLPSGLVFRV
jgi:hypothetical protein